MFFLISFVVANNYCIGLNTDDECKSVCNSFKGNFDGFFTNIPSNDELNQNNTIKHNLYIASNVSYLSTDHNLIICDPSINLIYQNPGSKIKIKDHIYLNSNNALMDVPILFRFNSYIYSFDIEVETAEDYSVKPFILDFRYTSVNLRIKFLTDYIPENLISISGDSYDISINDITKDVSKVFNNPDKLLEISKKFYCISDKEDKCSNYKSLSDDLNIVDSMSEISIYENNYIIVDTSVPQIYKQYNTYYLHIIVSAGSDVTFYNYNQNSDFYVIMHEDAIEMQNTYFEGEGKFSFVTTSNFSLLATSATNKYHFSIRSNSLYSAYRSHISALRSDLSIELNNKIYVPEYNLFYGPNCLSGLFESDKFLGSDDGELLLYNVTSENLIEYDYQSLTYYFGKGDHEIPKTWKHKCTFRSIVPNETSYTFTDVYSYDGTYIDYFININSDYNPNFKTITIKPASYFYLSSFKSIEDDENIEKYNIQVDKDFVMYGNGPSWFYDKFEISHDQCTITGNGTISFNDKDFKDVVEEFCKIDEGIQLKLIPSIPNFYVCIGQSDLDTCKSKINEADSSQDADWVWLRNVETVYRLNNHRFIYIADKYDLFDYFSYDIIMAKDSHLTVLYYSSYYVTLYSNKVEGYRTYTAIDSSAKLTVLFKDNSNFKIDYHQPVTDFNFRCYFKYDQTKLYMKYVENFTKDSINLDGNCQILIREHFLSRLDMFKKSESIYFMINKDRSYNQICYSDKPVEMDSLYDFVLCTNHEEFKNASTSSASVYIFKNISLDFVNNRYYGSAYDFFGNITVSSDLPNNATIVFYHSFYELRFASDYYRFYFNSYETKFVFGINESLSLDYVSIYSSITSSINFTSSKDNMYIFPYPDIRRLKSIYTINVPENLTILSPAPQYIEGLFGSHPINYAPNWSYYHFSDEGKLLYGSHPSILFDNFENDENLPENIVLAVGKDDVLTVPSDWAYTHNVYIYQGSNDFNIYKPLNITYSFDGVTINHKMKFVAGYINANMPPLFTVNSYFPCCHHVSHYPYKVKLDLTENPHVDLYVGSMNNSYVYSYYNVIGIYNRNDTNTLTVNATDADSMNDFKRFQNFGDSMSNVKYYINYNYICYYPYSSPSSECPGTNYFHIKDVTTLYDAMIDYSDLIIYVTCYLDIPYTTGDHYKLSPKDDKINIDLPNSPESMEINENNLISFIYSDGSIYDILNKSNINVVLTDIFKLVVNSNTDSIITFSLGTNVFISAEMNCDADFYIPVKKNKHHLYTDNITQFGNLLNDTLELYVRGCAYDSDSISLCTFPNTESIEKVFTDPFMYNEVEIALASTPKVINLPSIKTQVPVYIRESSSASLTLSIINNLQLTNDSFIVNELWNFEGDLGILRFKLNTKVILSIDNEITTPIILELSSNKTLIDLKNCELLSSSKITILKLGNEINEITVFGTNESYSNFINNLADHEGINIIRNGTQKYLCICENIEACNKCENGIEGIVQKTDLVRSDPGEDTKIRVFTDFEMPSNIFNNEHQVFINAGCTLNLTDIDTVDQSIDDGLKVDNLHFVSGSNLLLKPNEISMNIIMKKFEQGKNFTIELDTFLRLNVTNSEEKDIVSSLLYVNGSGELNCYDYPFERIRPVSTVRVIKGVYIICGVNEGNDICSYQSVERYKRLGNSISFKPGFDTNSKILVFLDSYTSSIDAHLGYLSNQKVQFIRKSPKKSSLLENGNNNGSVKLRFLETTELVNKGDSTTGLSSTQGGAFLDNADSDLFIVGFDENLTIKQEGTVSTNSNAITIQPMSDKGTIFIDDSVNIENQKLKIETETDKKVSITIRTNKNISNEDLKKYISVDDSKIEVTIGDSSTNKSKKGLPISAIIGIVIGVIAIVAVVVVIVILVLNKRKLNNVILSDDNQEFSDSTF